MMHFPVQSFMYVSCFGLFQFFADCSSVRTRGDGIADYNIQIYEIKTVNIKLFDWQIFCSTVFYTIAMYRADKQFYFS